MSGIALVWSKDVFGALSPPQPFQPGNRAHEFKSDLRVQSRDNRVECLQFPAVTNSTNGKHIAEYLVRYLLHGDFQPICRTYHSLET